MSSRMTSSTSKTLTAKASSATSLSRIRTPTLKAWWSKSIHQREFSTKAMTSLESSMMSDWRRRSMNLRKRRVKKRNSTNVSARSLCSLSHHVKKCNSRKINLLCLSRSCQSNLYRKRFNIRYRIAESAISPPTNLNSKIYGRGDECVSF